MEISSYTFHELIKSNAGIPILNTAGELFIIVQGQLLRVSYDSRSIKQTIDKETILTAEPIFE